MMSFKSLSRVLVFVGALASAQSALAQVQTAENGVSWNMGPSLTFSGSGINAITSNTFGSGDSAGQISVSGGTQAYLNPWGAVWASQGEATFNFATQQRFFGMTWGTVDTSNVLSFYNGDQLLYSMSGANILGTQPLSPTNSVNAGFSFAEVGFTRVVLMDDFHGRSFEARNMTYSAEAVDVAPIPLNAASLGGLMSFLMMLAMRGKGGTQVAIRMALASIMPRRRVVA
jgi:hypothetical protein